MLLHTCVHAKSLQSCPTLCNPMNYRPPVSSVPGILQARILEWVAMPSEDLPNPRIEPTSLISLALASGFFITSATWEALHALKLAKFDLLFRTQSQNQIIKMSRN